MKVLSAGALAATLAALSMLGPFSIDAYLPAFPNIQATLHASLIEVQQSLTFYMLSSPAWCCGTARCRTPSAAAT
jgi:DHA1 family bicyclomycin/chloramphenicol resistance-like MFS transporter